MTVKKTKTPEKNPDLFILDFEKVQPKKLDKTPIKFNNLHQQVGEALNMDLAGIAGRRLAEKVYDGGKIELSPKEKIVLSAYLNSERCTLMGPVVWAILEELDD